MNRNQAGLWILALGAGTFFLGCGGSAAPPPINVSIASITAQSVNQGQLVSLAATVANDTSAKGVTWSVSCSTSACGKVSSQTAISATYLAPSPVTANYP